MGAIGIWSVSALGFAAAGGAAAGRVALRAWRRRSAAENALAADGRQRLLQRASKGVQPLRPVAVRLLELPGAARMAHEGVALLEDRGVPATPQALASLVLAAALVAGALAGLLSLSAVCGAAVGCLCIVTAIVGAHNRFEKQCAHMREQVPDALRSMGTCFRSGLSLPQVLQHTAAECKGALGRVFGVAARRLQMGAAPDEALAALRGNSQVPELSFVAVALDVQHQSGGSIAPVLETARESVMSELDLMRSLRVQTAQAKLSASIVTVMPFALIALFSLISPGFLDPFFGSVAGMGLLALALIMQLAGVMAVRHMLRIDAG